jgi:hypothetical protein
MVDNRSRELTSECIITNAPHRFLREREREREGSIGYNRGIPEFIDWL